MNNWDLITNTGFSLYMSAQTHTVHLVKRIDADTFFMPCTRYTGKGKGQHIALSDAERFAIQNVCGQCLNRFESVGEMLDMMSRPHYIPEEDR